MAGLVYDDVPNGLIDFLLLTVFLGGAGAIASGRAIAGSWKSFAILPLYMLILAAVLRFLHYALFVGDLRSIPLLGVAFVITLIGAAYGYRSRRALQMGTQYSWLYAKAGPLGWVRTPSSGAVPSS